MLRSISKCSGIPLSPKALKTPGRLYVGQQPGNGCPALKTTLADTSAVLKEGKGGPNFVWDLSDLSAQFSQVDEPGKVLPVWFVLLCSLFQPAAAANVLISEFMATNTRTLPDEDGEHSDWIEIHNSDNAPVNLLNWSLTDRASNLRQWRLPPHHGFSSDRVHQLAPFDEPVAGYGPFVMNSRAEIQQAYEEFQLGRMGASPPKP